MDVNVEELGKPRQKKRLLVIGVGGGGSNAVARMTAEWADGPETVVVNTDERALTACPVPVRVQIGRNLTLGMGAGGDASVGRLAAEDDTDMLRELVSHTDVVFIVVGLGGGVGTGAAPVLASLAREEGALTLAFATLPFAFEGERKKQQAEEGLGALRAAADVVVCLPNERLMEQAENQVSLTDAFTKADAMVGTGIRSLWKLLTQTGIINLDFADLRHLVENSGGACNFGYGEGEGSNKAIEAIADILRSPLLERGKLLEEAGGILVNMVGGADMTLLDVQMVMSKLTSITRSDTRIFMGATVDEAWANRLAVTVLATENRDGVRPAPAPAAEKPAVETAAGERKSAPKASTQAVQEDLKFETVDKGRFRNVEPTVYNGEDLDIPTFIRRGVKLSPDK